MGTAEKTIIRKTILEARAMLSKEEIINKSSIITNKLLGMKKFGDSRVIMCYMDFKNEVMTGKLIRNCIKEGMKVSIPYISVNSKAKREMLAAVIEDMENDCEIGTYGIMEPKKDRMRVVDPKEIDCVIVPGVAFDLSKNRIGYGAGYYDRFLKSVGDNCLKIGIAFDMQIVNYIPSDENDIAVDLLLTENRNI